MQISGINKFSLIDFPGEISCIIFTPGCNFRCPFCHNSEFVLPEKLERIYKNLIPEKIFLNFLDERKGKLTGVSICGGEPTLQKDLLDFCKKIKKMGFLVKLDTNGRSPEILKKIIDKKLIDYISMDIKHEVGRFNEIVGVEINEKPYIESISILLNSNINYEFRTTVAKKVHNKKIIENIAKTISGAKNYYIQNFRNTGNLLNPNFSGESFLASELREFQIIAEKYIQNVGIRE